MENPPIDVYKIPKFIGCEPQEEILYGKYPYRVRSVNLRKEESEHLQHYTRSKYPGSYITKSKAYSYMFIYFSSLSDVYDFVHDRASDIDTLSGPLTQSHSKIQLLNHDEKNTFANYKISNKKYFNKYDVKLHLQTWTLNKNPQYWWTYQGMYDKAVEVLLETMIDDSKYHLKSFYADAVYTDLETAQDLLFYFKLKYNNLVPNHRPMEIREVYTAP